MSENPPQQGATTPSKVNMLDQINCWIFDLDNTLYPVTKDLLSDIDAQMSRFVSNFLNIDLHESRKVQKKYFREYGLTLRGLMIHHKLDPAEFLKKWHPQIWKNSAQPRFRCNNKYASWAQINLYKLRL